MRSIARIAGADRRCAGSTGGRAVRKRHASVQGTLRSRGAQLFRASAMTVVVASLSIVVAAFGIKSAAVGQYRRCEQKPAGHECVHAHCIPPHSRLGTECISSDERRFILPRHGAGPLAGRHDSAGASVLFRGARDLWQFLRCSCRPSLPGLRKQASHRCPDRGKARAPRTV